MDGVGRVTAGTLLRHFPGYAALRDYPREQILTRLKGLPGAAALVNRLLDPDAMQPLLDAAEAALRDLASRSVRVLAAYGPGWPPGLGDLPRGGRPALLYTYGNLDVTTAPRVALVARPPLSDAGFERAQALIRVLVGEGVGLVAGLSSGFDTVAHRLSDGRVPAVHVASCGLGRIPNAMRPVASAAVRSGGLLLSSFPMDHGPFDHDEAERIGLQAALAPACVFVEPRPGTPERHAMEWALSAGRAVFALAGPEDALPERVHRLRDAVDDAWVVTAARAPA